jgi:hypothetical protein
MCGNLFDIRTAAVQRRQMCMLITVNNHEFFFILWFEGVHCGWKGERGDTTLLELIIVSN